MKFSYNWLQSYFKEKLPAPDKLAELLTIHSFEVEGVEKVGQDWVLDVSVTANRAADCFSHAGIAYECAAILNYKPQPLLFSSPPIERGRSRWGRVSDFIRVEILNSEDCLRYTALVLTDIKIGPSPLWLQERLKVCGLRSINNIVDATNYVMLETGQPLHAFDFDKIYGQQPKSIIIRRAKAGEKIATLEEGEKSYNLTGGVLLIADSRGALAIAGIKGGKKAEITGESKTIVLESANFNPRLIRQAARSLKLQTDASLRFEHGLDPNVTQPAINMVAALIQKISRGKLAKGLIDVYPKKVYSKKIKLNFSKVESLLGAKISPLKIKNILINSPFNFKIKGAGAGAVLVEVPTQRKDIIIAEDLIEEIGRIYGYERIPAILPAATLILPAVNENLIYQEKISDALLSLGFSESLNYSLVAQNDIDILGKDFAREVIALLNPISEDKKYLRPTLLTNLLKNVKDNLGYFQSVQLFEIGKIFTKLKVSTRGGPAVGGKNPRPRLDSAEGGQKFKVLEKNMLAGILSRVGGGEELFYELKGAIDNLLNRLGITDIWYDDYQPTPEDSARAFWLEGKAAEIKVGKVEIGFLGEINPRLSGREKIFAFEMDWPTLIKLASEERFYQPPSKYPAVVRDLAVLVAQEEKVERILNVIEKEGGPLLIDVDLFDFYEGAKIAQGKKSLAFHLIFQSEERSLSDKEVNEIQKKIIEALEGRGWKVRK